MGENKELKILLDKDGTNEEKTSKTKVKTILSIMLTFVYALLTAVSMICAQALDGRIQHFQLNGLRFFLPFCTQGVYYIIKQKLPYIERGYIKVTVCYCAVLTFCALFTYIPATYIALATANTLYLTANILWMIACGAFMRDSQINAYQVSLLKVICYGSDPVVISLQLTNFQSLVGLRMNHIVFR